jgi:hypothetical protein
MEELPAVGLKEFFQFIFQTTIHDKDVRRMEEKIYRYVGKDYEGAETYLITNEDKMKSLISNLQWQRKTDSRGRI